MKHAIVILLSASILLQISLAMELGAEIKQSKKHHENYHKLVKDNARLNDWYQNHDCEVSYEPCMVAVECEIK